MASPIARNTSSPGLADPVLDSQRVFRAALTALANPGTIVDLPVPAQGPSPLHQYLRGLRGTVERIAAGPFACEAVAEVRNAQFIELCHALGDAATARLYEEIIQPEEVEHHHRGRQILERYATTPEVQARAAAAMRSSLAIADELKTLAEKTTGVHNVPVS